MITTEYWRFATANFIIRAGVCDEQDDPADHFDDDEDIKSIRSGAIDWFVAIVEVTDSDENRLSLNTLGGCSYKHAREFFAAHRDRDPMNRNCSLMRAECGSNVAICHYFPGMVSEAVHEARDLLRKHGAIYIRN